MYLSEVEKVKNRFYKRKEYYFDLNKSLNKKYNIISNIRFLMVVLIIYLGFKSYESKEYLFYFMEALLVIGFFILVNYHLKIKEKRLRSEILLNINKRYMDRASGEWMDFPDKGQEYINLDHNYSNDLDIVGENSIFQFLNIANTHTGRKIFSNDLLYPKKNKEEIKSRQAAIRELSKEIDLVQEIEYLTYKEKKNLKAPDKLIEYAESSKNVVENKYIKNIIRFLPILTISVNLLGILLKENMWVYIGLALAIVQVLIWLVSMFKNSSLLSTVGYLKYNLETYLELLKLIEKKDFKSEKLMDIKDTMFSDKSSSIKAIKELDKITQLINIRSGGILNLVLNAVFLWDYQCIFLLEAWKIKYGEKVEDWIEGIGQIESLMSFSVLANVSGHISFPEITTEEPMVVATQIGHPLINKKSRVNNNLELDNEIFIITGSNMSGKTTFLRTIGINLVLAYNGAPVCARNMECSILDIMTSMRVQDDLAAGISTFYAEILRIKKIIDKSEEDNNMIFLIDEIFTGTNSPDRIAGAKNVLANLNKENIIGAITTHDLELCELDSEERIENYHFKDVYKDDNILFDYKIKSGKSTSTNAKNLMRLAGIKIILD